MSYSWGSLKNIKPSSPSNSSTVQNAPVSLLKSDSTSDEEPVVTETKYTIEKGFQFTYMSDEWNVYIADAISDSLVKVESWGKTFSSEKSMKYDKDIGTFKINDPANGFSWID